MAFDDSNPETWLDLSQHPSLCDKPFDPSWYDGDVEFELRLLRSFCIGITRLEAETQFKLVVLDDYTFYAIVSKNHRTCEVGPALMDLESKTRGIGIDFLDHRPEELPIQCVEQAQSLVLAFFAGRNPEEF